MFGPAEIATLHVVSAYAEPSFPISVYEVEAVLCLCRDQGPLIDPLLSRCEAFFYCSIVSLERSRHSEGHEYVLRAFAVVNE